jgi:hypothetical protein
LRSLLHYSGLPISSSFIVEGILAEARGRRREETDRLTAAGRAGAAR